MTILCTDPDPSLGVAIRLSGYLDCQARALGENGFQALAGGALGAGLLSGLVTIFVALIGYRLILGDAPALRDGVGWAVRLGVVLALATGWPAFQTVVYQIATDGPQEVAALFLPAAGLPSDDMDARIQAAYDAIRLGSASEQPPQPAASGPAADQTTPAQQQQIPANGRLPAPQTASLFVVVTTGTVAALRMAIGFLLAVGPIGIMGLLFDATLGFVTGWLRALVAAALSLLAATIVVATSLVVVEGELLNAQGYRADLAGAANDPQALPVIVLLFGLVMLVATIAASRMALAFRLPRPVSGRGGEDRQARGSTAAAAPTFLNLPDRDTSAARAGAAPPTRAGALVDSLATTMRRENDGAVMVTSGQGSAQPGRTTAVGGRTTHAAEPVALGVTGRRSTARPNRAASMRDRMR